MSNESSNVVTIEEITNKLEELDQSVYHARATDVSSISWLLAILSRGEWTDAEIDPSRNADAMKSLGKSNKHGGKGVPHPSSAAIAPTQEEQDVIDHFSGLHNRRITQTAMRSIKSWVETTANHLTEISGFGRKNDENKDGGDIESNYYANHIRRALIRIGAGRVRRQDDSGETRKKFDPLAQLQKEFREKLNYFTTFREAHDLKRDVKYTENWLFFGITILGYFGIETYANGTFYANVVPGGNTEGWITAVVVSIFIMASGAVSGWCGLRLRGFAKFEDGQWKKHSIKHMVGWGFLTLAFAVLAILCILGAYLYRDVAEVIMIGQGGRLTQADSKRIIEETIERLWALDLAPQSGIIALLVICVNAGGAVLLGWKIHHMNDCIPGYKVAAQHLREKRKLYMMKIQEVAESGGLKRGREYEFESELKAVTPNVREQKRVVKTIIDSDVYSSMQKIAEGKAKEYTDNCQIILQSYRLANCEERPKNDRQGPAYFKGYPTFDSHEIVSLDDVKGSASEIEAVNALDVERVLEHHLNEAVAIFKDALEEERRERIAEHEDESKKEWQIGWTKKQKDEYHKNDEKMEKIGKRRKRDEEKEERKRERRKEKRDVSRVANEYG